MDKIASFTVNHEDLEPGVYVSRKDRIGAECITTFDVRITQPNDEPVMGTGEVHTIEHLGATFLRNDPEWRERTVYFGPMGCRTGFYVIFAGAPTVAVGQSCAPYDCLHRKKRACLRFNPASRVAR